MLEVKLEVKLLEALEDFLKTDFCIPAVLVEEPSFELQRILAKIEKFEE